MNKNSSPSFSETRTKLSQAGLSEQEITSEIKGAYTRYADHIHRSLERIDDQANTIGSHIANQLIALAILLMTAAGVFIAQQDIFKQLTLNQKVLILLVFSFFMASAFVGMFGYLRTLRFWKSWAEGITAANELVEKKIDDGDIKVIGDIRDSYTDQIKALPKSQGDTLSKLQLGLVIGGGALFLILLAAVLFDFSNYFVFH